MTIQEKQSIVITQVTNGFIINGLEDDSKILVFRHTFEIYDFLRAHFDGEKNHTTATITN
jgi:hypothetical protein